jgi:hypothetical protein
MALTLTATSTITIRMVLDVVCRAQTAALHSKNEGRENFSTLGFQNMCRGLFSTPPKISKIAQPYSMGRGSGTKKAVPLPLPLP